MTLTDVEAPSGADANDPRPRFLETPRDALRLLANRKEKLARNLRRKERRTARRGSPGRGVADGRKNRSMAGGAAGGR